MMAIIKLIYFIFYYLVGIYVCRKFIYFDEDIWMTSSWLVSFHITVDQFKNFIVNCMWDTDKQSPEVI